MKQVSFFLCFLLLFVGRDTHAQEYNFDRYTVEDGLALNQVLATFQDSRGFIYLGTNQAGISVFDGKTFRTFNTSNGLVDDVIYSFAEDDKGLVYISTNGGLSVYDGLSFTNYTQEDGLLDNRVFHVMVDRDNQVWLSTNKGVQKFSNGKFEAFEVDSLMNVGPVFSSFQGSDGTMYWGTIINGLFKWDGNQLKNYRLTDGLNNLFIRAITEDAMGNIWLGTFDGISVLDNNDSITDRVMPSGMGKRVTAGLYSSEGIMWFTTEKGMVGWKDDELVNQFDEYTGLDGHMMLSVCEDQEGNIWFGSNGTGLWKYNPKIKFVSYSMENSGLSSHHVNSVYEDKNGRIWVAGKKGLSYMDVGQPRDTSGAIFTTPQKYSQGKKVGLVPLCNSLMEDNQGRLWIGSRDSELGLGVWNEERQRVEPYNDPAYRALPSRRITCLTYVSKSNTMWGGLSRGVFSIRNGKFKLEYAADSTKEVWDVTPDDKGGVWICTEEGVMYGVDGEFVRYKAAEGLTDGRVRNAVFDHNKNVWFGTNKGVFVYDGTSFKNIALEDGILSNTIYSLQVDAEGNVWYGSSQGVGRIMVEPFIRDGDLVTHNYGRLEGFKSMECNTNSNMLDRNGNVWFGTVRGITMFDPTSFSVNKREAKTYILGVRLNFEKHDWTAHSDGIDHTSRMPISLEIPIDKNHLTFDFVGISTSVPEKVKYQWKMDPVEKEWHVANTKTEAVYSSLGDGDYTFIVRAMNNDGVWNEEPATFSFTILPPWYKTWWSYSLFVLVIGLLVYSYIKIQLVNAKIKRQQVDLELKNKLLNESNVEIEKRRQQVQLAHERLEDKNQEIIDSINYAKRIQSAILPADKLLKKSLVETFVLYKPKDIIAGDFYWMETVQKENGASLVYYAAADCTGHGVPGAMVSVMCSNALSKAVKELGKEMPADILDQTVKLIEERFEKSEEEVADGMDVALVRLDLANNKAWYSGANNPLWIARNGELLEFKADKQPIGAYDYRKPYTNHEVNLEKGDVLYTFSDGFIDQFGGPRDKKFKAKQFRSLLLDIKDKSMKEQHKLLDQAFEEWRGVMEQIDDVCVIGVRI